MSSQTISLPDGRKLGYITIGKGSPVMYFHGTASSRLEVQLLKQLAIKGKMELIAFDRPGYGLSTYKPKKSLQDLNSDLNFLADHLGIKQFNVLGWSGGGVFALAYITGFPQRINRGIIVSTPDLPFDASTAHNIPFIKYLMKFPFIGKLAMHNMRYQVLKAYCLKAFLHSSQGKQMLRTCSDRDLMFFSNATWMGLMHQSMAEAFRQNSSVNVVLEEHKLFLNPWNLSFKNVGNKLWIWQGIEDKTCPVKNAYNIARKVEGCNLEIFPKQGHCVMFDNVERLIERLRNV